MSERVVRAGGIELCTAAFGDPTDPPILLVMGVGASMLWWDEALCHLLAERHRYVIRYDHRDTGRSTTYPVGRPGYTGADLVHDAAAVLDGYGIGSAHVVGVSAGGALAQLFALEHAKRVRSLVLISTSPATGSGRDLPAPTERFVQFVRSTSVDWSDSDAVVDYLVAYARMLAGGRREFDEAAMRELVRGDVERAHDIAATRNHDILAEGEQPRVPISTIGVPTLVVHGTADPMFALEHGEALAAEIPGARLLMLTDAGHGVDRADWPVLVDAIAQHTGMPQSSRAVAQA